jgi:hypothetical protein
LPVIGTITNYKIKIIAVSVFKKLAGMTGLEPVTLSAWLQRPLA